MVWLRYLLTGLLLLPTQSALATSIFEDPTGDPALLADDVTNLVSTLQIIVFGAAGAIAAAMIIWGGIILASAGGNEEKVAKGKKILTYSIGGVIFIVLAQILISAFIQLLGGGLGAS